MCVTTWLGEGIDGAGGRLRAAAEPPEPAPPFIARLRRYPAPRPPVEKPSFSLYLFSRVSIRVSWRLEESGKALRPPGLTRPALACCSPHPLGQDSSQIDNQLWDVGLRISGGDGLARSHGNPRGSIPRVPNSGSREPGRGLVTPFVQPGSYLINSLLSVVIA